MEPGTECDLLQIIAAAATGQCSNMQWFNLYTSVFYYLHFYTVSDLFRYLLATWHFIALLNSLYWMELEAGMVRREWATKARFNAGVFAAYFVFPCD